METKKDISCDASGSNMQKETKSYVLNLERRVGETKEEYHKRLFAIRSTQIGLISEYEREIELERYRTTDKPFKHLLEEGEKNNEELAKQIISTLHEEVKSYIQNHPHLASRKTISEKLKDLESIT